MPANLIFALPHLFLAILAATALLGVTMAMAERGLQLASGRRRARSVVQALAIDIAVATLALLIFVVATARFAELLIR